MRELGDHGTRFEFECYDVGHLYNLAHLVARGLVKPPFFVKCIFGVLGDIGPDPENLIHMRATADRLFGNDCYLSVLGLAATSFRWSRCRRSSATTSGSGSRATESRGSAHPQDGPQRGRCERGVYRRPLRAG